MFFYSIPWVNKRLVIRHLFAVSGYSPQGVYGALTSQISYWKYRSPLEHNKSISVLPPKSCLPVWLYPAHLNYP